MSAEWPGILDPEVMNESIVEASHRLADAGKTGRWDVVIDLLESGQAQDANQWRFGGTSWFTPLHQAAWLGAPVEVAERLIRLGAWRSLRTADGARAVDLARTRGHRHLREILAVPELTEREQQKFAAWDQHLAALIAERTRSLDPVRSRPVPTEVIASVLSRAGEGWSSADLPLLDEARALVDGPPEKVYGHVVVDEAQQLTEMEWRMLMRRCPSCSMTIVGDLAQAGPTTTLTTWDEALEPFVGARFEHHTLTINYRTTAEILEASGPVLARIAPTQRLSRSIRHGEAPTAVSVAGADVGTAIAELVARLVDEHPEEMIGIIVAPQRVQEIASGMVAAEVTVVPAPEARGLEFDTVILVDPDGIRGDSSAGLRDLYVARTRATKRLVTVEVAPVGAVGVLAGAAWGSVWAVGLSRSRSS